MSPENYFVFRDNRLELHYKDSVRNYYFRYDYSEIDEGERGDLSIYSDKKNFEDHHESLYYQVHFDPYGMFLEGSDLEFIPTWDERHSFQVIFISKSYDTLGLMTKILGDWKCEKRVNLTKAEVFDTIKFTKSDFSDSKGDSLWFYHFSRTDWMGHTSCFSRCFDLPNQDIKTKINPIEIPCMSNSDLPYRFMRPYLVDLSKRQIIFFYQDIHHTYAYDIIKLTENEMVLKFHNE